MTNKGVGAECAIIQVFEPSRIEILSVAITRT